MQRSIEFDGYEIAVDDTDDASWEWGLSLRDWGRPGALTEWFVNGPDGLEHGFTIPRAPEGKGDGLIFEVEMFGGLRAVFADDGQAVDFYDAGNVSVLRYAKLVPRETPRLCRGGTRSLTVPETIWGTPPREPPKQHEREPHDEPWQFKSWRRIRALNKI